MARFLVLALLAAFASAFVPPTVQYGVTTSAQTRASTVMIGKSASKPKKVAKKETGGFWANFGLADFAMSGRDSGVGGLELLNPTVNKRLTPKESDTRTRKENGRIVNRYKPVAKSGKINPK